MRHFHLILPGFNEKLAKFALEKLRERGIEVKVSTKLSSFSGDEVIIEDAHPPTEDPSKQTTVNAIQTRTLVWTAGVTPADIIKNQSSKLTEVELWWMNFFRLLIFPKFMQ